MTDLSRKPIAVIKVNGDVLLDDEELQGLVGNVKELVEDDWNVVLLHGGASQTNALQEKLGITTNQVAGRRITSKEDLKVVKQAIAGEVNVDLVAAMQAQNVNAFGCHGASGKLIQAVKRPPRMIEGEEKAIDFGEVGDVTRINSKLLQNMLYFNLVPVIATLGISDDGKIYNINADTTVVAIARALQAELLLFTSKKGAIYKDIDDPESRIKKITRAQATHLISDGVFQGDTILNFEEAMGLLDYGVEMIGIASSREPGTFIDVADGRGHFGTLITD
ncbi:acetylglutamate kinase [Paraneptunicella aestuarii]|uniref:acetylglutamate kinase n=1 Tax=Paraneptunicella aestuarii TaxID=2831148 RepID=UPI001E542ED7|nr:acetylglutamate kinase [Paraneptunicella aestuarii]UAA38554.1 acetylglutamate kinase [Paraneptunicella aestuarii]